MIIFLLLLFLEDSHSRILSDKEMCKNIDCDDTTPVCGIRQEGEGFRLKLFDNECRLLENGCLVDDDEEPPISLHSDQLFKLDKIHWAAHSGSGRFKSKNVSNGNAYGIINMEYCDNSFKTNLMEERSEESSGKSCAELECPTDDETKVCALRTDNNGFRLRIFDNKCQLWKYNCENDINFIETDSYMCDGIHNTTFGDKEAEEIATEADEIATEAEEIATEKIDNKNKIFKLKNVVIVDNMINLNNINESIDNFFAATHVFDLPLREVTEEFPGLDVSGRRMRVRNAGPVKVFKPWTTIPKNISTDTWHLPTINSCYHKCPKKCPDTYAPVCGVPGTVAREPNLTFQNHCFMDAAQCKMKWEDKGPTALSSYYIESSFLFCLGEELNGMYRFLPLVRTLQHMGRLKKKGYFRYKLSNLKFFNNFLNGNPNFMG